MGQMVPRPCVEVNNWEGYLNHRSSPGEVSGPSPTAGSLVQGFSARREVPKTSVSQNK